MAISSPPLFFPLKILLAVLQGAPVRAAGRAGLPMWMSPGCPEELQAGEPPPQGGHGWGQS
jgi:hypothetical protein